MAPDQPPAVRVSDAERERTVAVLGEQHTLGRITYEEFTERMDRAYEARTRDELDALTRDLPATLPPSRPARRWVVSVMGGDDRTVEVADDEIVVLDVMGGSDVDLTEAEFPRGEVTVRVFALMGGSTIWVPEGARVELGGFALMGGNSSRVRRGEAGGPLVRVRAISVMGGIDVRTGPRRRRARDELPRPPRP